MDERRNFVTAQQLQSHWKILPAELLNFIHSGLPAYQQTGIVIEAEELLPEKTLFDITKELLLRAVKNIEAEKCRRFITLANIPSSFHPRDFKGAIGIVPPNISDTSETLNEIDAKAKRVFARLKKRKDSQTIKEIGTFLFNRREINVFAQMHRLELIDEAQPQDSNTTTPGMIVEPCIPQVQDCESFIRSLQISYVSDTEIKIRGGGKNSKIYGMKDLGFLKEKSKAWNAFILILNSKDHRYRVGAAHGAKRKRKTSYDIGQKVLVELNKKFVPFFNKIYQLQLPEKYRVYELIPGKAEAPGTYRFKFQIKSNHDGAIERDNELPKDQLLQKIGELSEEFKKFSKRGTKEAEARLEGIKGNLYSAVEIALQKEWLTKNRVKYYISDQSEDSNHVVYPKKIRGRWINDINDSSPDEHSIEDEESSQED